MSVAGQTLHGRRTATGTNVCQCRSPTHRTQLTCRAGAVLSAANASAHMRQHGTRHMHMRHMCCNSTEQDNATGGISFKLHTKSCSIHRCPPCAFCPLADTPAKLGANADSSSREQPSVSVSSIKLDKEVGVHVTCSNRRLQTAHMEACRSGHVSRRAARMHSHSFYIACRSASSRRRLPRRLRPGRLASRIQHSRVRVCPLRACCVLCSSTFAPLLFTLVTYAGSVLYSVFEWQAYLSVVVGGLLSFNVLFPSDQPTIARLMGCVHPLMPRRVYMHDHTSLLALLGVATHGSASDEARFVPIATGCGRCGCSLCRRSGPATATQRRRMR